MLLRSSRQWYLRLIFFALLRPQLGKAEELPEHFIPVRPNALGGAFTAIANDEDAVWTNPAGVARVRKARSRQSYHGTKFPNISVGANTKSKQFFSGIQKGTEGGAEQIAAQADSLDQKPFWAQASAFPVLMISPGVPMAIGPFGHMQARGVIDNESPDQARLNVVTDIGGAFAFAIADRSNRVQLGMGLRSIQRYSFEDTVPVQSLGDQAAMKSRLQNGSNQASGLGVDLGAMWTMADFWFPTLGVAVLNAPTGCKKEYLNPFSKVRETVCGNVFSGKFGNPDAISAVDPTDIRFGVSITPRFGRNLAARLAVDVHHFHVLSGEQHYGLSGVEALKLFHSGIEVFIGNPLLPSPLSVSAGLNQGYYSMGVSTRLEFISLDIATFGRDISSTSEPIEDRRVMGSLSFDF